jgi:cytidylate kinase
MSIIAISRGSYSRGSEVADRVAEVLGYKCISREVLIQASTTFNIPEIKLVHAINNAPSFLDRISHGKERYISYIRTALLRAVQWDDVVYHGFAGHYFLQGIPHVLKVRIIADLEDRIREEMQREDVTAEHARSTLSKDDEERRKWGMSLYGIDPGDPGLYDMVLHIQRLGVEDIVKVIADAVKLPPFQTTPDSQSQLDDRVLASQVESLLVHEYPRLEVRANQGEVFIRVATGLTGMALKSREKEIIGRIEEIALTLGGARKVKVSLAHSISID